MSDSVLELRGFDELLRAFEQCPEIAAPVIEQRMGQATLLLAGAMREYPAATEANQPGRFSRTTKRPLGYYDRGRGWWYPVQSESSLPEMTGKRRGAIRLGRRKQAKFGAVGYKLRRSSEQLGKAWTTDVRREADAIIGVVGNNTSYAERVQGRQQAQFHAARGWQTLEAALGEQTPAIYQIFEQATVEIIQRMAGQGV
jgi:hypothetical protein